MSLAINSSTPSLYSRMTIRNATEAVATPIPRLSSGLRISGVSDTAEATGIAGSMSSQNRELNTAGSIALNAISVTQQADSTLANIVSSLERMKNISVQAASTSLTSSTMENVNDEFLQLKSNLLNIAHYTQYNGKTLFDFDSNGEKQITSGAAQLNLRSIALVSSADPEAGILTRSEDRISFTSDAFNISTARSVAELSAITNSIDAMLNEINNARMTLGAFQEAVSSQTPNMSQGNAPSISNNRIPIDWDFSSRSNIARDQILQQVANSELLQQANNPVQAILRMLNV